MLTLESISLDLLFQLQKKILSKMKIHIIFPFYFYIFDLWSMINLQKWKNILNSLFHIFHTAFHFSFLYFNVNLNIHIFCDKFVELHFFLHHSIITEVSHIEFIHYFFIIIFMLKFDESWGCQKKKWKKKENKM